MKAQRGGIHENMKKITVTFEFNEPQWDSVKKMADLEPCWHYCDVIIRSGGQDIKFQGDFLRDLFRDVRANLWR